MNIEIRKQLAVLELGDLAAVIENQEKDVSLVDLNYNDRLEHLSYGTYNRKTEPFDWTTYKECGVKVSKCKS